jgi:hypothetical protein
MRCPLIALQRTFIDAHTTSALCQGRSALSVLGWVDCHEAVDADDGMWSIALTPQGRDALHCVLRWQSENADRNHLNPLLRRLVTPAIPIIIIGVAPKGKATNTSASPVKSAGQVKPDRATISTSGTQTSDVFNGVVSRCNDRACQFGPGSCIGRSSEHHCHGPTEDKCNLAHSSFSWRGSYHLASTASSIYQLDAPQFHSHGSVCGVDFTGVAKYAKPA